MQPDKLQLLLQLPFTCLEQAQTLLQAAPRDAVALAMRAVAVQMLLTTQLRLGNLISLRIGQHLQSHDPVRRRFQRLDIASQETKNRKAISRPIGATTRAMMHTWERQFRPHLSNDWDGYFFPGHGIPHITPQGMRDAVKDITRDVVGVALTPHDFRALVGKIHLLHNPGDYGTVKHLLNHDSIFTTMENYTADEGDRAAADFDELILRVGRGAKPTSDGRGRPTTRTPPVSPYRNGPGRGRRK